MSDAKAFTVWFTGLSGSGKSTLAGMLRDRLAGMGLRVEVLDSGKIRQQLNRDLGFTREQVEQNLRRIAYECKLLNRNGVIAIVSAISPYRDLRREIRADVAEFVEVYCRCSMEELLRRDDHSLFEKAQSGQIQNVAGINAPYEEPLRPEVLLNTDQQSAGESLNQIVASLQTLGRLPEESAGPYSEDELEQIRRRLSDIGYM
ncbi:MAG: putative adenylyl-sulfate kinase [Phycisphaerae bacterium]|nr:putative adenylyl-sulfate kinase [Phycisphaerae bacterium]